MPHLNNNCHIPFVNWCEKEIKYKKIHPSPVGSKDSYLIKLDTCLHSYGCFTAEQEKVYLDKKDLYSIYDNSKINTKDENEVLKG